MRPCSSIVRELDPAVVAAPAEHHHSQTDRFRRAVELSERSQGGTDRGNPDCHRPFYPPPGAIVGLARPSQDSPMTGSPRALRERAQTGIWHTKTSRYMKNKPTDDHRRRFLKTAAVSSLALATSQFGFERKSSARSSAQPNILVVVVDEMRLSSGPMGWIPDNVQQKFMPNLYRLWQQSACFHNHYTAATACSPARASLITGLYAHQHFLLSTVNRNSPLLNPAFPTYGSLLSTMGYDCYWWGKFHLAKLADANLSAYGFAGKERYDPIGYPGEGLNGQINDQEIANQFVSWLNARRAAKPNRPFCTTVSFINNLMTLSISLDRLGASPTNRLPF